MTWPTVQLGIERGFPQKVSERGHRGGRHSEWKAMTLYFVLGCLMLQGSVRDCKKKQEKKYKAIARQRLFSEGTWSQTSYCMTSLSSVS